MIISQIIGGLGNQMFQYAVGRALSLDRRQPLRLDISAFANYELHQGFELHRVFNCSGEIATRKNVNGVLGWQSPNGIRRFMGRPGMRVFRNKRFVVEPHFPYWAGIKDMPCDCYLMGYWQSEKYFLEVAEQIRADFSFKLPLGSQNSALVNQISQVNAVSLHVRRGDYVSNSKTTAIHGLCSLDYYRASIRHVAERVRQPYFFIFSDDITWVKNNLTIEFPCEYVNHNNGAESYNDMRVMSLCKHHIIANSSFSWWGAWLNASPGKMVVAPKKWFVNQTDVQDLFPSSWVTL